MLSLKNGTVIITGGVGLIGSAFTKACAEYSANVVIADIDEKRGIELRKRNREQQYNFSEM